MSKRLAHPLEPRGSLRSIKRRSSNELHPRLIERIRKKDAVSARDLSVRISGEENVVHYLARHGLDSVAEEVAFAESSIECTIQKLKEENVLHELSTSRSKGREPIHDAVHYGNNYLLLSLVQQCGAELLDHVDARGNTVLHHAVQGQQVETVKLLLGRLYNAERWNHWLQQENADKRTPLQIARQGLTYTGAEVSPEAAIKYEKWYALEIWAYIVTAEDLIKAKSHSKQNILHHLACKGLPEKEADSNESRGHHAQCVIRNVVHKLKEAGILDEYATMEVQGRQPVHEAALNGNNYLLSLLQRECQPARNGATLMDTIDKEDNTILHLAIRGRHLSTVKYLLYADWVAGADHDFLMSWFEKKNRQGKTPIHLAVDLCFYGQAILEAIANRLLHYTGIKYTELEMQKHKWQRIILHTTIRNKLSDINHREAVKKAVDCCKRVIGQLAGIDVQNPKRNNANIKANAMRLSKLLGKRCKSSIGYQDVLAQLSGSEADDISKTVAETAYAIERAQKTSYSDLQHYFDIMAPFLKHLGECDVRAVDFSEVHAGLFDLPQVMSETGVFCLEYLRSMVEFTRDTSYRTSLQHLRRLKRRATFARLAQNIIFDGCDGKEDLTVKLRQSLEDELTRLEDGIRKADKVKQIVNIKIEGKSLLDVIIAPSGNHKMLQEILDLGAECDEAMETGNTPSPANSLHAAAAIKNQNCLVKITNYYTELCRLESNEDADEIEKYFQGIKQRFDQLATPATAENFTRCLQRFCTETFQRMQKEFSPGDSHVVTGAKKRLKTRLLQQNAKGETPIHIAAREANAGHVKYFISLWKKTFGKGGLREILSARDAKGYVPFLSAAAGGSVDSAVPLATGEEEFNIYARDNEGKNALTIAMENKHLLFVKMMLFDVDDRVKALHDYASKLNQHPGESRTRLQSDAPDDDRPEFRREMSWESAQGRYIDEKYRTEVFNGVDTHFLTVLHHAVLNEDQGMVEILLRHGTRECLYKKDLSHERTPYLHAVKTGNERIVKMLYGALEKTQNALVANDTDKHLNGAGHIAAQYGHLPVIKLLQRKKVDLQTRNAEKKTPLEVAIEHGKLDIAKFLIHDCKQVEYLSCMGQALVNATLNGHTDVVTYLLSLESPDVPVQLGVGFIDGKPYNILDTAITNRNKEMASAILSTHRRDEVLSDILEEYTPFQKLMQYLPDVGGRLLDQYVKREDNSYLIDYSLLDEQGGSLSRGKVMIITLPEHHASPAQIVVPWCEGDDMDKTVAQIKKHCPNTNIKITQGGELIIGGVHVVNMSEDSKEVHFLGTEAFGTIGLTERCFKDEGKSRIEEYRHLKLPDVCVAILPDDTVAAVINRLCCAREDHKGHSAVAIFDKNGTRKQPDENMDGLSAFQLLIRGQRFYIESERSGCKLRPSVFKCCRSSCCSCFRYHHEGGMMGHRSKSKHHTLKILLDTDDDTLVNHPVTASCIKNYWESVQVVYYLTVFMMLVHSVAFALNITMQANQERHIRHILSMEEDVCRLVTMILCYFVAVCGLFREGVQLVETGPRYLTIDNGVDITVYVSTIVLVSPWEAKQKHLAGAFFVLLTCLNAMYYTRAIRYFGIFICMLFNILGTILQYSIVLIALLLVFSACVGIILPNLDWKEQCNETSSHSKPTTYVSYLMRTVSLYVIMNGEVNMEFLDLEHDTSPVDRHARLVLLIVIMTMLTIILANLLIGLSVCDVSDMKKNAKKHILCVRGYLVLDGLLNSLTNFWRLRCCRKKKANVTSELVISMLFDKSTGTTIFSRKNPEAVLSGISIAQKADTIEFKDQRCNVKQEASHLDSILAQRLERLEDQLTQMPLAGGQNNEVDVSSLVAPQGGQVLKGQVWRHLEHTDAMDSLLSRLFVEYKTNQDFAEYLRAITNDRVADVLLDAFENITGSIASWTEARIRWIEVILQKNNLLCPRSEKEAVFNAVLDSHLANLNAGVCRTCGARDVKRTATPDLHSAIDSQLKRKTAKNVKKLDLNMALKVIRKEMGPCDVRKCGGHLEHIFYAGQHPFVLCFHLSGLELRKNTRIRLRDVPSALFPSDQDLPTARYMLAMVTVESKEPKRYWSLMRVGGSWWQYDPICLTLNEGCRAKVVKDYEGLPDGPGDAVSHVVYMRDMAWIKPQAKTKAKRAGSVQ